MASGDPAPLGKQAERLLRKIGVDDLVGAAPARGQDQQRADRAATGDRRRSAPCDLAACFGTPRRPRSRCPGPATAAERLRIVEETLDDRASMWVVGGRNQAPLVAGPGPGQAVRPSRAGAGRAGALRGSTAQLPAGAGVETGGTGVTALPAVAGFDPGPIFTVVSFSVPSLVFVLVSMFTSAPRSTTFSTIL